MTKKQKENPDKEISVPAVDNIKKTEKLENVDEVSLDRIDDVFSKPHPDEETPMSPQMESSAKQTESTEKKSLTDLEKKEKKVRLTVLALGILIGCILSGIIFGYLYYRSGVSLCSSYNSITTSEKKLTGLIVAQKNGLGETVAESSCPTTITISDKVVISSWESYENKKYGLVFKLPADFKQDKPNTADQFFFKGSIASNPYLTIEIADATKNTGIVGYTLEAEKTSKVACVDAKISYYTDKTENNPEKYRIKVVEFTSENIPYRFEYKYLADEGESITNGYSATFDLLLKTIIIK